ncbi:hypothetical protein SELMODRAFT_427139 [Selaginella moellendorffii]|uniref:Uncharacterized protein n=1 Tax=Selaginella moellendorffii TaxID=88036 RepID=D8SYM4_SELML|nr:hypothetical protein SELMODRAFT_427139 [Selaginella moellendorffii]
MTRGIVFRAPDWAKEHLQARRKALLKKKREREEGEEQQEQQQEEVEVSEEEEEDCYDYVSMGSSDYWSCYLRFMFIAAHKMVQQGNKGGRGSKRGGETQPCEAPQGVGAEHHSSSVLSRLTLHPDLITDEASPQVAAYVFPSLSIGQPRGRISRMAALLNKLAPFFPVVKQDLEGTPYAGHDDSLNLDAFKTLEEVREAFNFQSELGIGCTAQVE